MTGMQTLIALRKAGVRPNVVFVDLVKEIGKYDAEPYSLNEYTGIVSVNVADGESLNDLDFRPLVGLRVHASDNTENPARYRRLCSLIAKVNPEHLVMAVWRGEELTVHQRWAGAPDARTESFSV
jgi:hypothetical protein